MKLAVKYGPGGPASCIGTSNAILVLLLDIIILGNVSKTMKIVGLLITTVGIVVIALGDPKTDLVGKIMRLFGLSSSRHKHDSPVTPATPTTPCSPVTPITEKKDQAPLINSRCADSAPSAGTATGQASAVGPAPVTPIPGVRSSSVSNAGASDAVEMSAVAH